jgi:hypothetical protein
MRTAQNRASASGGAFRVSIPFDLQMAGPVLAVVTFLTIWWGHVLVRIVHYYFGTRPAALLFAVGLALLFASTQTASDLISASLGIVGLTLLWDAFELHRQEARVRLGHAPLNPRVHKVAAGVAAARAAESVADLDDGGVCLSCGSASNTRYLCRRGPYCKVRSWDRYAVQEAAEVSQS